MGMDIFGIGALGSAAIGAGTAADQLSSANAARQAALKQWLSVNVPDPQQQAIELQRYQVSGQLSPQLEQAFQQSQTGLKGMQIDPASRAAEVQALTQMQNVASKGGLDAQAMQQEQEAINRSNTNEQGQRGAIEQSFAARGTGGSGAQLAAELQAGQGDANQAAAGGMSAAANAEQRALQAMAGSSSAASNLNNQDYTQAKNAAEAQDSINRFNTQAKQNVENTNVTNMNTAQAGNLQNQQNIDNQNTGLANTEETHNKGLLQQQFNDQAQIASGAANAEGGVANQFTANADRTANQWAGIGNALSQAGAAYSQKKNNDAAASGSDEDDLEDSDFDE